MVTVLACQHRQLENMISAIRPGSLADGTAKGPDLRRLQRRTGELRRCFVTHEGSKQRYLWPVVRRAWPDGNAIAKAAWRRKKHVEERFTKFQWLGERDPLASEVLDQVLAGIEEHVSLESHLLGRMRRTLPEDVRVRTGQSLARRQFLAPTRPHPHLPRRPWAAAVIGPVAGLVDRTVEAFSFGPSGS